jgi:hypothetical protein
MMSTSSVLAKDCTTNKTMEQMLNSLDSGGTSVFGCEPYLVRLKSHSSSNR